MSVIDKSHFERRGGRRCSNSDYGLRVTTCCGSHCVEDNELHDLYLDPDDLDRTHQLYVDAPCPFCGNKTWDLSEVNALDDVPAPWRWAAIQAPANSNHETPRIGIRSFLLLMAGVATLSALYARIPLDSLALPTVIFFVAWIVPCASIGFDVLPSRRGLIAGIVAGIVAGRLLYIWLMLPVVR